MGGVRPVASKVRPWLDRTRLQGWYSDRGGGALLDERLAVAPNGSEDMAGAVDSDIAGVDDPDHFLCPHSAGSQ